MSHLSQELDRPVCEQHADAGQLAMPLSPAFRVQLTLSQFAAAQTECREQFSVTPGLWWYCAPKRFADTLLAAVLLVLLAPVIFLGMLLIKLTSRGPAFYRQTRLGKDGHPFTLLKLRTMKNNAEAETGPVWSTGNDCRVTPLGKFLRTTHIDEFPQLVNVLVGQMSLVGPRPERPEFASKLEREVPFYRERLQVRPGITGLAQLLLPPDTDLESVRRKVAHDVYYVRHMNPFLDFKLLLVTAWRLGQELYGFCRKCFILPSPEEVERGFHEAVGSAQQQLSTVPITLSSIASIRRP